MDPDAVSTLAGAAPSMVSATLNVAGTDWTKYLFMFPLSIGVATTAMLTGIGGAALFTPVILLGRDQCGT
jgi:hypothetical protein